MNHPKPSTWPRPDTPRSAAYGREQYERMYMVELGQRIRALREERGLTQQALARSAGIATDMVSRLENGHYSSPGLRTLLRIAEGMHVDVGVLLPDHEAPEPSNNRRLHDARLESLLTQMAVDDLELLVDVAAVIARRSSPG